MVRGGQPMNKNFYINLAYNAGARMCLFDHIEDVDKYFTKFSWVLQNYIATLIEDLEEDPPKPKTTITNRWVKDALRRKVIKGDEMWEFKESLFEAYEEGYEEMERKIKEVKRENI